MSIALALDLAGCVTAFLAAWLWLLASGRRVRRVRHDEALDGADVNRLVTAMNRASLLNRRAALAATASAVAVALRFLVDVVG